MNAAARRDESHRLRAQADAIAGSLPPLLMAARQIAASVTLGMHGRRRAGVGDTFWQFRQYSTGDTHQAIDWRQSGKRDVVFVREREWMAAQTAALWCDTTPSMRYRSQPRLPTKAERAAVMTLALAELLIDGGERIIHMTTSGNERPVTGRQAIAQMANAIVGELAVSGDDADAEVIPTGSGRLPRHGAIVLVSDFLAPLDEITKSLRGLIRRGLSGHLVQILDPAEETLPFSGRIRFVGLEREGGTVIDRSEDARAEYAARLAAHRNGLKALADGAGWSFHLHHTDRSPQLAMAALHNAVTGHRR